MLIHYIAILVALALVAIISGKLERSPITVPMMCLAIGVSAWWVGLHPEMESVEFLRIVAEATLAIVLFADASTLNLRQFRKQLSWPTRMLLIGLPLAVGFGTVANFFLLPGIEIWSLVLLAALLAPTDAALGAAVFSNEDVPADVRDSVLAESGLNDGLALPFIIFAACAAIGEQHEFAQDGWLIFAAKQIGYGFLVGGILGFVGGYLLEKAVALGIADTKHGAVFALILNGLVFFAVEELGGNSFVGVFIAGMMFGTAARTQAHSAEQFLATEGNLLTMVAFVFIGVAIIPEGISNFTWEIGAVVALSLFVVRPLAIWLSLLGSSANQRTRLFLGWFGPRGLATALFSIFVLLEFGAIESGETILAVTACAVLASTVVHGMSAFWAGKVFEKQKQKDAA